MSFCTSLRNLIQIGPPSAEKMTSCRFLRWRISAILDYRGPIMGSLTRSPAGAGIANRPLVFLGIFFYFRQQHSNMVRREPA